MAGRSRTRSHDAASEQPRRRRVRAKLPPASADDLPRDLLDRPAAEGTRWLALLRLEDVRSAHHRLQDDDAEEALHRFRVALRRLRGTLRELRDLLDDSVSRKTRRQVADLAAAAGARRERDVHLAWLADERATLPASEIAGADWLERALRREWRDADAALRRELARDYDRVMRRLARRLGRYRLTIVLGKERPILATRAALAATIRRLADELEGELARMRSADDDRAVHGARIAAKRMRYVLEPLAARAWRPASMVRAAGAAVADLKRLQDDLGLMHDAHVLGAWLADRAAEAAARTARSAAVTDAELSGAPPLPDDTAVQAVVRTLEQRLGDRSAARWGEVNAGARRTTLAHTVANARTVADRLATG